jgi:hypothetical protein
VSVIGQIDISGRAAGIHFVEIIGLAVDKNISGKRRRFSPSTVVG